MKRVSHSTIFLALLLIPAGFVRTWNLYENPLWYTDETNYIILARNFGETFSLADAAHKALLLPYATDAVPHPPLYFCVNGLLIRTIGNGVISGRLLSALCGLAGMFLLYQGVHRLFGRFAAGVAAGLFAFHYPSVIFLRWGMPYNLSMLFSIAAFWAQSKARNQGPLRWPALSMFFAGMASVSSFFGLPVLVFLTLLNIPTRRKQIVEILTVTMLGWLPILLFIIWGYWERRQPFIDDFLSLGLRASGGGRLTETLTNFALQLARLFSGSRLRPPEFGLWPIDFVYVIGMLGIVWIALFAKRRRWVALFFFFIAFPILLKRSGDPEIKYDEVQFLFLIYAGAGALSAALSRAITRKLTHHNRITARKFLISAAILPIVILASIRIFQIATHLPSQYERIGSVLSIADAHDCADWVNTRAGESGLVIAPERMDFLLESQVANLYQTVAYTTGATQWHTNIESWRWAYPTDFNHAKFIIIDQTDRAIVLQPNNLNMDRLVEALLSPAWKIRAQFGEYYIYGRAYE